MKTSRATDKTENSILPTIVLPEFWHKKNSRFVSPNGRERHPSDRTKTTSTFKWLGFATGVTILLLTPHASAAITFIQDAKACNVIGLDSSPATAQGGVHCDTGNSPFSLMGVLNGTLALYVGNSSTPSWNLINDTGSPLTSFTLYYSGQLASNSYLDMQVSGTTLFSSCAATTATNVTTSDANCGTGDKTANNPPLPVKLVWSGGTGIAAGAIFNLGTASFAHAGQDAGCFSGEPNCSAVPEPSTYLLFGTALLGIGWFKRRFSL